MSAQATGLKSAALDPLSLRFESADLEAGFRHEYREGALDFYRTLALAVPGFLLVINLTGLLVAFSVDRDGIQRLLWFATIPLTVAALAALHVPVAARRPRRLVVAYRAQPPGRRWEAW